MFTVNRHWFAGVAALLAGGFAGQPTLADVTIVQNYDIAANGGAKLFASSGTITTSVSGDKSRTDSQIEPKSKLAKTFGAGRPTANIVRADKDLFYDLDLKKEVVTVSDFATRRAQLEYGLGMLTGGGENTQQPQADSSGLPVGENACSGGEPEVNVKRSGNEVVANLKTKRRSIEVKQSCTDPETGKTCEFEWIMEQWLAKKVPGGDEMRAFNETFAERMGLGEELQDATMARAQGIFNMFRGGWDTAFEEAADTNSHMIKFTAEMKIGGPDCTNAQGMHISATDIFADAADSVTENTERVVSEQVQTQAAEAMGDGLLGEIGGQAVVEGGANIVKGLFGGFGGKKKKQQQQQAAAEQKPVQPPVSMFKITSETVSFSTDPVPLSRYEPPTGWKVVDAPKWEPPENSR